MTAPTTVESKGRLNATEKRDLAELFNIVDNAAVGYLDWVELRRCLRGLGFPVTKPETRQLVRERCGSAGQVTLKQFYDIVEDLSSTHRDAVREIRGGFRLMSKNGTSVTEEDIVRLAKTAGVPVDAGQMLRMADADGDGVVGEEDFVHIMSQTALFSNDVQHNTSRRPRKSTGTEDDN